MKAASPDQHMVRTHAVCESHIILLWGGPSEYLGGLIETRTPLGFLPVYCALLLPAGYPTNVTSTEHMEGYPTWQDLLAGSSGGYTFDKQQQALWIKLLTSDSASIALG